MDNIAQLVAAMDDDERNSLRDRKDADRLQCESLGDDHNFGVATRLCTDRAWSDGILPVH